MSKPWKRNIKVWEIVGEEQTKFKACYASRRSLCSAIADNRGGSKFRITDVSTVGRFIPQPSTYVLKPKVAWRALVAYETKPRLAA